MSCDPFSGSDVAPRVVVQLRLHDSVRQHLPTASDPLPTRCTFSTLATFGHVHAYVRGRLLSCVAASSGPTGSQDRNAAAQEGLPVTYLHVVNGGAEVIPAPEATLASALRALGQYHVGAAGAEDTMTMSIYVRAQVFSG